MIGRVAARVAAVALLAVGATACRADGPDGPGARAASFDDDVGGRVLEPGDAFVVVATEFSFMPAEVVAEAGMYTGELVNDGAIAHNISFADGMSFDVEAGESVPIEFTVPEEGLTFICSISGHQEAGMSGTIHTPTSAASEDEANE